MRRPDLAPALGMALAMIAISAWLIVAGTQPARAGAGSSAALEVAASVPTVGPGRVDSFSVSCLSASATLIQSPLGQISYTCQNASTTLVHVGDSGIADPGTTRNAPVYCAENCPSQEFGGNSSVEYCRGDTDTTIYCRALVSAPTVP